MIQRARACAFAGWVESFRASDWTFSLKVAALAIREGIDLGLTIVGGIGFIPGYEKMIETFPFRERLSWKKSVPRQEVPSLLRAHDVLVQPSDEEDFGSSVAEAQACGLPVIVGRTNGNADYLCSRDIHLKDDRPETLAAAYREMSSRKARGHWGDPAISRQCAETVFLFGRSDGVFDRYIESRSIRSTGVIGSRRFAH